MFYIYQIKNLVNGKSYIGKTEKNPFVRWMKHISNCENGRVNRLYSAMRKYGLSAFLIEIVDTATSKKELNDLEKVWIFLMDSNNPDYGYNMTEGGDGGDTFSGLKRSLETIEKMKESSNRRRDVSTEEIIKLYLENKGSNTISEELGISRSCVLSRLKEAGVVRRGGNGKIRKTKEDKVIVKREGPNSSNYNHEVSSEEIVRLYESGKSTRQIASIFGVEKTLVRGRLRELGISPRPNTRDAHRKKLIKEGKEEFIDVDSKKLVELYEQGNSLVQVAKMFEITSSAVRLRLLKEGVILRNKRGETRVQ